MPDDNPPQAVLDLVHTMRDIEQRAAQQYRPLVDDILQTGSRDAQHIEHTLDGLLDFCGHEPVVLMYRQLCRHYWQIDQAAPAYYINAYREQWDSDEPELMKIALADADADADAEIAPVPTEGGGRKPEPELDRLSNILKTFNDNFGTLFADTDRVAKRIRDDIAPMVAADKAFQNARDNTPHTARIAHDQALGKVMQILLKDDTQVYKQFVENESFRRFVGDMVYQLTSQPNADRHA